MGPALAGGRSVLVARGGRVRPGSVVLAAFPDRPDVLVVKRVLRAVPGGWWLEGDDPRSVDSRQHGPTALVHGRVVWPRLRQPPASSA